MPSVHQTYTILNKAVKGFLDAALHGVSRVNQSLAAQHMHSPTDSFQGHGRGRMLPLAAQFNIHQVSIILSPAAAKLPL